MARECYDCFYYEASKRRCNKKRRGVDGEDPACSSFIDEDTPECFECRYAETDTGLFARNDTYRCSKHKKRVNTHDPACRYFIRDVF
ncbi:hypothetical protein [Intestinibacter sp.]|uniref:hypothetical protein n=1 Tax=Intestinibacter sp. TaxID=1965304 RepID=UPI003F179652